MHILAEVCTRGRYETTLAPTIFSLLTQTRKIDEFILYDDNLPEERKDLRELESFQYIFQLLEDKKIPWSVAFGGGEGQHRGHQVCQERARELVFRVDDDCLLEAEVIEELEKKLVGKIGAVGGLVLMPGAPVKECKPNLITDLTDNCQWFRWLTTAPKHVEHLYSSYLYRKGIQNFETHLSPVCHREETLHSFGIFKKGYPLLVTPTAVTYHLRNSKGGIREGQAGMWHNDDIMFNAIMREYGVGCQKEKTIFCDEGMGDHVVLSTLVPEILKKYKDYKINFYVTFPELFKKYGIECKSIQQGLDEVGAKERFALYEFMVKSGKKLNLEQAYREFYQI